MFETGKVSIITPVYNAERFIAKTIKSVQAQTYSNWELLLINDASSDSSESIIQDMMSEDARIKCINLQENSGAAVARNTGLDKATGQYVAFIDSDDMWLPDKLEKQLRFMSEHGYAFTYTNLELISEEGDVLKSRLPIPRELSYHDLLKNTAIACSTVMIDQSVIGTFKMPLVRRGQDTATWLMLLRTRNINAYGLDDVLNRYRQVSGSISSNRFVALKRTWYTYRHIEKLPRHQALYYFIMYVLNAVKRRT